MCTNKRNLVLQQIELQNQIQKAGINLVTCGHCGTVLLHETNKETIICFGCETEMDLCDCPDMFHNGMENNEEFL